MNKIKAAFVKMSVRKQIIILAIVALVVIAAFMPKASTPSTASAGVADSPTPTASTPSPSQSAKAKGLGACLLIDQHLHEVRVDLVSVGIVATISYTVNALSSASDFWLKESAHEKGAASTWLSTMSDLASQVRVKLSGHDVDGALAPMKLLETQFQRESTFCP
jgi:hypothetical protein